MKMRQGGCECSKHKNASEWCQSACPVILSGTKPNVEQQQSVFAEILRQWVMTLLWGPELKQLPSRVGSLTTRSWPTAQYYQQYDLLLSTSALYLKGSLDRLIWLSSMHFMLSEHSHLPVSSSWFYGRIFEGASKLGIGSLSSIRQGAIACASTTEKHRLSMLPTNDIMKEP